MDDAQSLPEPLRGYLVPSSLAGPPGDRSGFGLGRAENPACGDVVVLYVSRGAGPLEVRYQVVGCAAVLAVSAYLADRVEGLGRDAARAFDLEAAIEALGGLPRPRRHAISVCRRALHAALDGI